MSDEWQRLKALATELMHLTGPGQCVCSQCEGPSLATVTEKTQETLPCLNPVGMSSTTSTASATNHADAANVTNVSFGGGIGTYSTLTPYQRLSETVRCIVERSSSESSAFLARHAWCQDVTLYHVWHNIQQSHAASLQLLVRSLSAESSASLAAAAAAASPVGRRFRKDVQQLLEKAFQCKPWPNPVEKTMLARRCGLTVRQVGVWFSNRRARCWPVVSPQEVMRQ